MMLTAAAVCLANEFVTPTCENDSASASQEHTVAQKALRKFEYQFPAMGVRFRFVAFAKSKDQFNGVAKAAEENVHNLNSIISDYDKSSEISQLSKSLPHQTPRNVSTELIGILRFSNQLSIKSDGAFDPTIGTITKLWRMAKKRNRLPSKSEIETTLTCCGWQHVKFLTDDRIQIDSRKFLFDFGAIGKGLAADAAIKEFERNNITSALVDAGGDIRVSEPPPGEVGWKVRIESGYLNTNNENDSKFVLQLKNCAVATSGDAEQYFEKNRIRYSHIVDPRTGNAITDSRLVTVIAKDGASADAFASAFSVLDFERSLEIAKTLNHVHVRILSCAQEVDAQEQRSPGFEKFLSGQLLANPTSRFGD